MALKSTRTSIVRYLKPGDASEECRMLSKALRKEYKSFAPLYATSLPGKVAGTALVVLDLPPSFLGPLTEALEGKYQWTTETVAQTILDARDAVLAAGTAQDGEVDLVDLSVDLEELEATNPEVAEAGQQLDEIVWASVSRVENGVAGERNPFIDLDPEQTFGAKEAGQLLGRSYGYVKDHGADLGGTKTVRGAWQFTAAALAVAWPHHKGD